MHDFSDKYNLSRHNFFLILEKIYFSRDKQVEDQLKDKGHLYLDDIPLLRDLDDLVDVLQTKGAVIFEEFETSVGRNGGVILKVIEALTNIPTLPLLGCLRSYEIGNQNYIGQHTNFPNAKLRHFFEVNFRTLLPHEIGNKDQLIDQAEYLKILKSYESHLRRDGPFQNVPSRFILEELKNIQLRIERNIADLVENLGLIHVVAFKVEVTPNRDADEEEIKRLFRGRYQHLNCLKKDPTILQVIFKPMVGLYNTLEYFVVLLVKTVNHEFVENNIEKSIHELLNESLTGSRFHNLHIKVKNFSPLLFQAIPHIEKENYCLGDSSKTKNQRVWDYFFGFLIELGKFQYISSDFLNWIDDNRRSENGRIGRTDLCYWIFERPELNNKNYFFKFDAIPRSKDVWKIDHLSPDAREYFLNLRIVNSEIFHELRIGRFTELAEQIEIFMLGLKESYLSAFVNYPVGRHEAYETLTLEECITRPVFQIIKLINQYDDILALEQRHNGLRCSKLLNYFLKTFIENKNAFISIIGLDASNVSCQEKMDELIRSFIYPNDIFLKKILFIENLTGEIKQQKNTIQMSRHIARLKKIKQYLSKAMRGDVVIIRCTLACRTEGTAITQKEMSTLFYKMMHAGKRRKPLSAITAYLGFWELSDKKTGSNQLLANVFFVFKSSSLLNYHDLNDELKNAWFNTVDKNLPALYLNSDIRYEAQFIEEKVLNGIGKLQVGRLVVENIDKELKKKFIDQATSYVVYRDLMDDEFYADTAKWLIRGTEPRSTTKKKAGTKKTSKINRKNKADPHHKSQPLQSDGFHEGDSDKPS